MSTHAPRSLDARLMAWVNAYRRGPASAERSQAGRSITSSELLGLSLSPLYWHRETLEAIGAHPAVTGEHLARWVGGLRARDPKNPLAGHEQITDLLGGIVCGESTPLGILWEAPTEVLVCLPRLQGRHLVQASLVVAELCQHQRIDAAMVLPYLRALRAVEPAHHHLGDIVRIFGVLPKSPSLTPADFAPWLLDPLQDIRLAAIGALRQYQPSAVPDGPTAPAPRPQGPR